MDCQEAAAQLSAYFDDELASDVADRVSQHLESCQTCQAKLQSFAAIRKLSTQYREPSAEAPSWETFAARMNAAQPAVQLAPDQTPCGRRRLKDVVIIIAALAASVVILLSIRQPERSDEHVVAQQHSHSHAGAMAGMPSAPIDFQDVVLDFSQDSSLAVDSFASKYEGIEVSIDDVEKDLGFQPHAKKSLPIGVQLVSTRLLTLPECNCAEGECLCGPDGCNCVACVCQRPDGSTYMLVEKCKSQKVSFGNLPVQLVRYGDKTIQVTKSEDGIAVSWEGSHARMTAIGLRDASELDLLLASN
ncbi:MAG: zf-HC2 domain-containing protein [Phycisphaera sp. RhM]|nr:zf-HC2 domain-containing protein [Phycisphaera sp. RhM]